MKQILLELWDDIQTVLYGGNMSNNGNKLNQLNQQNQLNIAQGQAMGIVGVGTPYSGLGNLGQSIGSGYQAQPNPYQEQIDRLTSTLHRTQWELESQKDIRAQDAALLKRFFRMETWLKEAHPEIMEEFKAVNDLLRASGEEEL